MRTLLLATLALSASAQSSSCTSDNLGDKCHYGTSLLQVSASPETGVLLGTDVRFAQAPATTAAPAAAAGDANATTAAPESDTDATATTAAPANASVNETTTALPNSTNATVNETTTVTGCATREDTRAKAWFAETSPVGTPCVFGVDGDARDEGSHCIFDNGDFGSNGWCYTNKDRSSWGSCNDLCPLYGPSKQLGKKIDHMDKMVDKVAKALGAADPTTAAPTEESDETPKAVSTTTAAAKEEPKTDAKEA